MPALTDVITVDITRETRIPSQTGFGTPLLVGYTTHLDANEVATYTSLAGMVSDGFVSTDPLYQMAQSLLAQVPTITGFKVANTGDSYLQQIKLTVTSYVEGEHIKATVVSPAGVETEIDYTIQAGDTTDTLVAEAVDGLFDAISGITADNGGTAVVTINVEAAGSIWMVKDLTNLSYQDSTGSVDYSAALDAIEGVDDDWFMLLIDLSTPDVIEDVADWVSTRTKMFVAQAADVTAYTALATSMHSDGWLNTVSILSYETQDYPACALAGRMLPFNPGSAAWYYKELTGVTPSVLTSGQEAAIEAQSGNFYSTLAGLNMTFGGKVAGGEWADVMQGIFWLTARTKERLFTVLVNTPKLSYTDASADILKAELHAQLQVAVDNGLLADGSILVSAPKVLEQSSTDRGNRYFPGLKFDARLADGIKKIAISGTVSV